jgi:branched-chain amino acid transport system permease protein
MNSPKLFLLGVIALALVPLVSAEAFFLHTLILIFFYVALSSAWNILAFSGNVSLGHGSFFGLAAYTSTILYAKHGIEPWLGLIPAIFMALVGASLLIFPLLRLRGPMFSLASIALLEVLRRVAIDWRELTAGSEGITLPATPGFIHLTFTTNVPPYYIFLVLAAGTVFLSGWIYNSATGHHLRAIASDEEAVEALGINAAKVKLTALFLSAGITGVLAVFFTQYIYMIDPDWGFSLMLFSVQPALNCIIGGMNSVWGPVLGAVLMTPLGEFMRSYLGTLQQGFNFVVYGIVLIVVVMVIPGGLRKTIVGWAGWLGLGKNDDPPKES